MHVWPSFQVDGTLPYSRTRQCNACRLPCRSGWTIMPLKSSARTYHDRRWIGANLTTRRRAAQFRFIPGQSGGSLRDWQESVRQLGNWCGKFAVQGSRCSKNQIRCFWCFWCLWFGSPKHQAAYNLGSSHSTPGALR